jgi:hypothetical protein
MKWFKSPHAPSRQSASVHALNAMLRTRGFAAEDFELDESPCSDLSQLLGVDAGILRVRCESTGEERVYSTGSGSAWLGAFQMDLGKGHFAKASRRVGESAMSPQRSDVSHAAVGLQRLTDMFRRGSADAALGAA